MGHVLSNNLQLGGSEKPLHLNPEIQQKIAHLNSLMDRVETLTERERKHIVATNLFARGYVRYITAIYIDI